MRCKFYFSNQPQWPDYIWQFAKRHIIPIIQKSISGVSLFRTRLKILISNHILIKSCIAHFRAKLYLVSCTYYFSLLLKDRSHRMTERGLRTGRSELCNLRK
uniref:Uncharacterized protein n=1 Tax=Cacopsylla melanoneura TaxID=428564 RepID=A0A8D9B9U4_9HEMI